MGKKKCGKSTLVKNILKDNNNINNSNMFFNNCTIWENKKEKFRFYEMKGFERRYNFYHLIKDINNLINNQLLKKDPDKFIHCIYYCFNHQNFNDEEYKYINELKSIFSGGKILICFISTITKDKKEVSKIFNKLNENNDNYVECRILAEPLRINDGRFRDIISP